jgi:hypothetical protein
LVFPRARAEDEFGPDGAAGVAVTGEPQLAPGCGGPVLKVDFSCFVQVVLVLSEVTSSYQKEFLRG